MNDLMYGLFKKIGLPLLTCSGCIKKGCEYRKHITGYPCISWRKNRMKEIDKIKKLELNPEINRLKKENNQLKFVIDVSTRVHEYYSKNGIDIRKLAKLFMEKFSDLTLDKAFGYAKDVSDGLAISLLLNTSIDIRCENMMMYCEEKQISKKYTELDEDVKAFIRYTYVIELLENFNTGKGE